MSNIFRQTATAPAKEVDAASAVAFNGNLSLFAQLATCPWYFKQDNYLQPISY